MDPEFMNKHITIFFSRSTVRPWFHRDRGIPLRVTSESLEACRADKLVQKEAAL
jgi:hypothetical protein